MLWNLLNPSKLFRTLIVKKFEGIEPSRSNRYDRPFTITTLAGIEVFPKKILKKTIGGLVK